MKNADATPCGQFLIKCQGHAALTSIYVYACVFRLELLLQRANKIQNMALDCEEKLTLAKNTLQAVSTAPPIAYFLSFPYTHMQDPGDYIW